ncbi:hypothetical protein SPBR_01202 [Sporothrix brasiliensis 5110]|uniref:Uncharacterized protein n=1 Tax=Sporothrix brasiliensis 5110 TaxID=1398154 RepID=A0A0C2IYM2_9PEZI|nr:uncharacterized protein SPBR_01202 [Sporothrix brasiliensis 5110]KIH91815.1 hypothetical protein SPBR_01202 [Sporothrix brasiliensis 5110]
MATMMESPATVYSDNLYPVASRSHMVSGSSQGPFVEFARAHPKGAVRFRPFEHGLDATARRCIEEFQIYPFESIEEFCRHIPYASGKKDFFEKTGRESFEVFQYVFKVPGDDKEYHVMWDYNVGLVRMTPFFKCCKYSKTTPAKMLNLNPGLREITHSITGGSIMAQDFPSDCLPPQSSDFARMVIDPILVAEATRETELMRQDVIQALEDGTTTSTFHQSRIPQPHGGSQGTYQRPDIHSRPSSMHRRILPPPESLYVRHIADALEDGRPQLAPINYSAPQHDDLLLPSPQVRWRPKVEETQSSVPRVGSALQATLSNSNPGFEHRRGVADNGHQDGGQTHFAPSYCYPSPPRRQHAHLRHSSEDEKKPHSGPMLVLVKDEVKYATALETDKKPIGPVDNQGHDAHYHPLQKTPTKRRKAKVSGGVAGPSSSSSSWNATDVDAAEVLVNFSVKMQAPDTFNDGRRPDTKKPKNDPRLIASIASLLLFLFKFTHPRLGLLPGHDKNANNLVNNFHARLRQDLAQRHLLADLDQAAGHRLHIAVNARRCRIVLGRRVPRYRQDVRQVVAEALRLVEGLDKVRLQRQRVQEHRRVADRALGHVEVVRAVVLGLQPHRGILHLGRLRRRARAHTTQAQHRPQALFLARLARHALVLAALAGRHHLGARGNVLAEAQQRRVLGVDGQAARTGLVGLVGLVEGQQRLGTAEPGLGVGRVEAQRAAAVERARPVVAQLQLAGGAVAVQLGQQGVLLGDLVRRVRVVGHLAVLVGLQLGRLAAGTALVFGSEEGNTLAVELAGVGPLGLAEALVAALLEIAGVLKGRALVGKRLQRGDVVVVLEVGHEEGRLVELGENLVRGLATSPGPRRLVLMPHLVPAVMWKQLALALALVLVLSMVPALAHKGIRRGLWKEHSDNSAIVLGGLDSRRVQGGRRRAVNREALQRTDQRDKRSTVPRQGGAVDAAADRVQVTRNGRGDHAAGGAGAGGHAVDFAEHRGRRRGLLYEDEQQRVDQDGKEVAQGHAGVDGRVQPRGRHVQ